ncbi:MAG: isoprenoid biosynthesis glyoxalase ElbB [Deltaproteobacteria bacterium]|nr:isoprenoid biosynthesis glyoxalase ElbB [Deltaproteobacteria bacterium]
MPKKIAIVLSGCGVKDGSEIHESVLTLLAVVKNGGAPLFFAPGGNQTTVTNHLSNDATGEKRNILVESARIARGQIKDLKELKGSSADALIFPGGYGAALNLCDFGQKGADCTVHPEVGRVIEEFHSAGKPIGFICIAPAIGARVLGPKKVQLTIGADAFTAKALEKMGAVHQMRPVDDICVDEKNRIVSTPAYMLAQNIAEAEAGISKLVQKIMQMA